MEAELTSSDLERFKSSLNNRHNLLETLTKLYSCGNCPWSHVAVIVRGMKAGFGPSGDGFFNSFILAIVFLAVWLHLGFY